MDNRRRLVVVWNICLTWGLVSALLNPTNYADLAGATCFVTGTGNSKTAGVDPQYLYDNQGSYPFSSLPDNTAHTYVAENFKYMFQCCGLVTQWRLIAGIKGNIQLQVWRRKDTNSYELIGENYCEVNTIDTVKICTVDKYDQILVRKGDFIGWHNQGKDMIKYYSDQDSTTPVKSSNRLENMFRRAEVDDLFKGDTYDWSDEDAYNDRLYAIEATYILASNAPAFSHFNSSIYVPDYISYGDTMTRFSYSDEDYNDNSSLVIVKTSTSVYYDTDLPSGYISAINSYRRQDGYGNKLQYFIYDLCYNVESATTTVTVTYNALVIENLDATFTVSVNDDERVLHTITASDLTDQVWCWEESQGTGWGPTTDVPFMLKAKNTAGFSIYSEYEFTLVENPNFDKSSYVLKVACAENRVRGTSTTVTGTISVYVTPNAPPVFTNLDAAVTVDSETAFIGDIIYNVTANDPDNPDDELEFTQMTCESDGAVNTDTFTILKGGHVLLKKFLTLSNHYQFDCEITVRDTSPSTHSTVFPYNTVTGNLHISVININHPVTIRNMPPDTIEVQENMPVGTSLWKFEYLDVDDGEMDVKTWSMSIDVLDGTRYFYLDPESGLFSLAFSELRYDASNPTTYIFTIKVGDVKSTASGTFSVTVINENEPPWFTEDYYTVEVDEDVHGTVIFPRAGANFSIEDEDLDEQVSGEDHTYSLDCGEDTHRFYMDKTDGSIAFEGDYDFDVEGTPSEVECTITVTDKYGLSDTANLYIHVKNVNEYGPEFTKSNYTFYLSLTTLVGTYLETLSAVDLDSSDDDDNVIVYTIDENSPDSNLLAINNDGALYLIDKLDDLFYGPIIVQASNFNTSKTGTTDVYIKVPGTTTVTTTTTDRNTGFYEDQWSYYWLLATLFGVTLIIIAVSLACYRICRLSRIGPYCYACCMRGICCRPRPPPSPPRGFGDMGYDLASFGHRHRYADENEELDGWLPKKHKVQLKKKSKKVEHDRRFGTPNHGYDSLPEAKAKPIYEMFRVPSVPNQASYLEPHRGTKQPAGGDRWKDRNASRR